MYVWMCVWYMYLSNQIADFGVSEEIEQTESSLTRWAGTPAFVAPECLTGNQPITTCMMTGYYYNISEFTQSRTKWDTWAKVCMRASGMHVHVCVCICVYVIHWTVMRHDNVRAIKFHIPKNNTNCIVSIFSSPTLCFLSLSLSLSLSSLSPLYLSFSPSLPLSRSLPSLTPLPSPPLYSLSLFFPVFLSLFSFLTSLHRRASRTHARNTCWMYMYTTCMCCIHVHARTRPARLSLCVTLCSSCSIKILRTTRVFSWFHSVANCFSFGLEQL